MSSGAVQLIVTVVKITLRGVDGGSKFSHKYSFILATIQFLQNMNIIITYNSYVPDISNVCCLVLLTGVGLALSPHDITVPLCSRRTLSTVAVDTNVDPVIFVRFKVNIPNLCCVCWSLMLLKRDEVPSMSCQTRYPVSVTHVNTTVSPGHQV